MTDPSLLAFGPDHPLYGISIVFVFVIGACIGSFLNVVIWRVPRGESIVTAPSHCPKCNHHIRPWENIPILGWLMLLGKCSKCRAPISARYPTVEFMTAILMVSVWMRGFDQARPVPMIVAWLVIMAMLVAIIYIDLDHMIIPDSINLFGVIVALVLAIGWPSSHDLGAVPSHLGELSHRPLLMPAVELIMRAWEPILQHLRLLALLDVLLGILFGGGILWLLVEIGKLIFGRRKVELKQPVVMTLDHKRFLATSNEEDEEDETELWEELFMRERDKMIIKGYITSCTLRAGKASPEIDPDQQVEVTVNEKTVSFADHELPLDSLKQLTIRTQSWVEPREAMGLGDVKMLAMLGAFLGPGAAIFILAVSSLLGSLGGILSIVLTKGKLHTRIPYGPYIALAAMLYILFSREIITLYVRAMYRFLEISG